MKRTNKRILSLLLTLCMVLSLMPAMTITASAGRSFNSWVGEGPFNYTDSTAGSAAKGWTWDGTSKTLTLSGVDAICDGDGIHIDGDATVVLEGANTATAVTRGLYSSGNLTIEGSGTLEITGEGDYGLYSNGNITIKSGYITVAVSCYGVSSNGAITVDGGYVSAGTTSELGCAVIANKYIQTGGYVKAAATESSGYGIYALNSTLNSVSVSGGYLDASGGTGIACKFFTNSGGVVKATGTENGIDTSTGTEPETTSFTGGVTIAESENQAISGSINGLSADGEKLYSNTDGSPTISGDDGYTGIEASELTSVVIAKAIEYTSGNLDGHYVLNASGTALTPPDCLTVSGGSYIESNESENVIVAPSVTVNGTLVCVNSGSGNGVSVTGSLNIAESGTLFASAAGGAGIYTGSEDSTGSIASDGNLIGNSPEGCGIATQGFTVRTGYVFGSGGENGISVVDSSDDAIAPLTITGGYTTALTTVESGGIGLSAEACTVGGAGAITASGSINGIKLTKLSITNSGTVNAYSDHCAIEASELSQSGGTMTATGGTAITVDGNFTISGGTVTATGETKAFNKAPTISSFKHTVSAGEAAEGATDVTNIPDFDLAGDGITYVKIAPSVTPPSSGGGSRTPATPAVPIVVDGQEYNIGKANTSGGVTTVTVDQTALQKQLDSASDAVVIPITPGRNADTVVAQLVVANVDEMAEKEMTLSVQVDNVSYDMPPVAIDTKTLMQELGATDPAKVPVNVTIKELDEDDVTLETGELMLPPVDFTVTASYSGSNTKVTVFEKYVQRVIEVPDGTDAGKITTAVVVENGKQRHVPTEVFQKDGKWYARINSLTNSVYALINNEKSFADAEGKWFEDVVTEMASRGIIGGRNEGIFDGDADITRAEFAAILVRALGLPENGDATLFTDIDQNAWYYGAVGKAYEYGLVGGRGEGLFDPNAKITRQEAMQMIYNASEIAPIQLLSGINPGLYTDLDTVSDWAKVAASFNLLNGLVQGDDGFIRPLDNITRGETATILLRLLQKSGLVDARAQA